ncbi:unnamed protein product [Medioppia subpectinata]|uniref:Uncharacterized protein n=1 Tax=Medioppia subpectinata TaxID=1979941 RepID=A0A7R9KVT1_9ACAR|nr:unnamed protein product [Medioppia subpectinata]CAG2109421.1 unnamed protein product [Medioppia subpectinata]
MVHLISVIGVIFSILFHIFVREPSYLQTLHMRQALGMDHFDCQKTAVFRERASSCYSVNLSEFGSNKNMSKFDQILYQNRLQKARVSLLEPDIQFEFKPKRNSQRIWSDWFRSTSFWRMSAIYMLCRLFVNITQVYTPLYLQESLLLAKLIMGIGCGFGLLSCIWIFVGDLGITLWQVFCVAALFGIGGTAMLIGSLSLTADLIGENIVSQWGVCIRLNELFR